MAAFSDDELYRRGAATLLASWEAYARASPGAAVHRLPGVAAAVFPAEPERGVYNNALLERADALSRMEEAYARAGVARFAAWAHEDDAVLRGALEARGYVLDTTTRAMGMALGDLPAVAPGVAIAPVGWGDYLRAFNLPGGLLRGADHRALHPLAVRRNGSPASVALAFDFAGDCGIYNVGTVEAMRRRGLATAVTGEQLRRAQERGCRTASIQATAMAERLYAGLGFRDLGRFLEYVPLSGARG